MAGRPAVLKFHSLKVGEKLELKGRHKKFVYQYVYQFHKAKQRKVDGMALKHYKDVKTDRQYVERIS